MSANDDFSRKTGGRARRTGEGKSQPRRTFDDRPARKDEAGARGNDRHSDRPSDRASDRPGKAFGDRYDDRRPSRPGDKRGGRPGDRRNDRPGERRDDRRDDRRPSRPGERRDDRPGDRRDDRRSPNAPRDRYGRPALRPEKREGAPSGQRNAERRDDRRDDRPRHTPRPFELGAWPAARALFPPLAADAMRMLDMLPEALAKVWPLNSAHRRTLPDDIAHLSRLLTTERAGLDRPYWSSPASISAYLYYFLPWNLVRLTRVLSSLPLPDPRSVAPEGGEALLVDVGSGPLTLPLALWLAKPEWRTAPLRVLALDTSSQPLELGKTLMEVLGELTGQPVWPVRVARAPLDQVVRQAAPLLSGGKARPWLISAANVLNELRFGKKRSRGASAIEEEDEFDSLDNEDLDFDGNPAAENAEAEKPEGCREDRLDSFLESLSPLFDHVGAAGSDGAAAVGPSLLFVEPGTRLGGSTIMRLRQLAVDGGLTALSPCPHQLDCPLLRGQGGRTWCHFTFGSEGAPLWLEDLSLAAGLGKSGLSLSPLLLAALPETAPEAGTALAARVLSAPFVVPGLSGRARYACSSKGMLLLENAEALASGDALAVAVTAGAPRDRKSGALLVSPPSRPGAESVLTRRPDRPYGQEGQSGQERQDGRDRRDGRDFRDGRDARDGRDGREGRSNRDNRDNRDSRDNRGQRPAPHRRDDDRPAGRGQSDRPARAPHGERSQRDDRNGQGGRPPRPQGNDRPRRDDRQGKPDRQDRQDRQDRPDRSGRQDRQDRNNRGGQGRDSGRGRDGGQSRDSGRGAGRDRNGGRDNGQNRRSGPRGGKS